MYQLFRNKVLIGVILYLIPFGCSFLIFRLFSFIIEPAHSIENAIYAYCIYIILLLLSFIGGYWVARSGKQRSWWVKFFFALIAIFQFLPVTFLAIIGAFCIYVNAKFGSKYSKFGCTVTAILAAVSAFSLMLLKKKKGNIKTSRNISKAIFVINHLSSGDYFIAAMLAMFRNWRVMIGANLWKIKIFHWFFDAVGIPIERERDREAAQKREEAVEDSKMFLHHNHKAILEIFAQGTRERNPKKGVTGFKKGAFRIACDLEYDVVPVIIIGTDRWRSPWIQDTTTQKGKKQNIFKLAQGFIYQFFKTGINPTIATVVHGNPISSKGKTPEKLCAEVESIMNLMYLHYTTPRKKRRNRRSI